MKEEKNNKIIINNYFFISYDNLKKLNPKQAFYPLRNIHENNLTQKVFLNPKKTDITIVKQEKENGKINTDKKNNEDNRPIKKDNNITIDINNKKRINFLSQKNYFVLNYKKVWKKAKIICY